MQTAREILDKSFILLGDDKHQQFSDKVMLSFLNEGYKELARKCKFTQQTTTYNFTANLTTYTLPQDLIEINFFVLHGEKKPLKIERISPENYEDTRKIILTGMGEFTFIIDKDTDAILTYWSEPNDLLINDVIPLIDSLAEAITHYITYKAYSIDQSGSSLEKIQMHYTEYLKLANKISNLAFSSMQQKPVLTSYQGF